MEQIQKINILRIHSKVKGNQISIELPDNFNAQEVEMIIIPKQGNLNSNINVNHDDVESYLPSIDQLKLEALKYADNHPVFPLSWSQNKLTREEINER